jgi:hypothetical protein
MFRDFKDEFLSWIEKIKINRFLFFCMKSLISLALSRPVSPLRILVCAMLFKNYG